MLSRSASFVIAPTNVVGSSRVSLVFGKLKSCRKSPVCMPFSDASLATKECNVSRGLGSMRSDRGGILWNRPVKSRQRMGDVPNGCFVLWKHVSLTSLLLGISTEP